MLHVDDSWELYKKYLWLVLDVSAGLLCLLRHQRVDVHPLVIPGSSSTTAVYWTHLNTQPASRAQTRRCLAPVKRTRSISHSHKAVNTFFFCGDRFVKLFTHAHRSSSQHLLTFMCRNQDSKERGADGDVTQCFRCYLRHILIIIGSINMTVTFIL